MDLAHPHLVWAGYARKPFGTQQLLFSCPHILLRQLSAAWLAGVVIAALLGGGTAFRLAIAVQPWARQGHPELGNHSVDD